MKAHQLPKQIIYLLMVLLLAACAGPDATNIQPHQLFTDRAVLQRDTEIPVWGKADPGGTLEISLAGNTQQIKVNEEGYWQAEFPAMEAGGPYVMEITGGDASIVLEDILIGDVWLASGQSNMEWPLQAQVDNYEEEIAQADYPEIRLFSVERNTSYEPLQDLDTGQWQITSPETIGDFSAVAYFFGREVQQEIGVPIGLIKSAWGGTPAEAWTSEEALMDMQEFEEELQSMEEAPQSMEMLRKERDSILAANALEDSYSPDFNTDDWDEMELPTAWESVSQELSSFNGFVWFQKEISLPASVADEGLALHLGSIDDADITWFNGEKIGETRGYNTPRAYQVPASAVQAGTNTITVRVQDNGGNRGFTGSADEMYLEQNGERLEVSLTGNWHYEAGNALPEVSNQPRQPAVLYNAMINPLVPYKIRGVIWYQGESNAGRPEQYQTLFPLMIEDWRTQWDMGDFPFLFVQLANFITGPPGNNDWAYLREAQAMALDLDNTGMAVTIDIGDSLDIHPRNKQDVGRRLALTAFKVAYGMDNAYSGPLYESMRVEGDSAVVTFKEVAEGLMVVPGEKLQGFTIAGEDRQFYQATARIISENEVSVQSPQVNNPVAVRYGWANNPKTNLYNEAFLPASPFRTDDWERENVLSSGI